MNRIETEEDSRWHALTLGTLSEDEAARLRAETPERYALRRPFTAEEQDGLFARVERTLDREARVTASRSAPPPWWQQRRLQIGSMGLAFALSLALFSRSALTPAVQVAWSPPRSGEVRIPRLSSAAVPPPDEAQLNEAIVSLRTLPGGLAVRGALLVRPGSDEPGSVRRWKIDVERADTLIIAGTRRELFPGAASGEWEMYVAVGRPGPALPEKEILRLADEGPTRDVQVLRKRVVLDGPCLGTRDQPCRDQAP